MSFGFRVLRVWVFLKRYKDDYWVLGLGLYSYCYGCSYYVIFMMSLNYLSICIDSNEGARRGLSCQHRLRVVLLRREKNVFGHSWARAYGASRLRKTIVLGEFFQFDMRDLS